MKRNDGKVAVSFRIPTEIEQEFHQYCSLKRIKKGDMLAKLIKEFLVIDKLEENKKSIKQQ